jgi:parvulin-like peptidyl-prolyl isomerase
MKTLSSIFLFSLVASSVLAENESIGHIGDTQVSVEDVRASLAHLDSAQAEAVRRDPKVLEQVVRGFLVQKLVLKEALTKKWDQEPAVVVKLARVRDSAITESYLESVAEPPPSYPNESELKAAYESGKAGLLQPRSFRLAQIFIAAPKAAAKAPAKLAAVTHELQGANVDFAAIATAQSEEPASAARGGELGWLPENQIQPEIRAKISGLKLFAISEPIRLEDGWHILKVLDVREPYTPTLEQVRAKLTTQMRKEKLRANSQAHLAQLLKEQPLALNVAALAKLVPDAAK